MNTKNLPKKYIQFKCIFENNLFNWFKYKHEEIERDIILRNSNSNPWIVKSCSNNKFMLIDGYFRYKILKNIIKFPNFTIDCKIIPSSYSFKELVKFRINFLDKKKRENINGIVICNVIKKLKETGLSNQSLANNFLPLFGMDPLTRNINQIIRLNEYLTNKKIPDTLFKLNLRELIKLVRFSKKEFDFLILLLEKLNLGVNKWNALSNLIDENCRIRDTDVISLFEIKDLKELIDHKNLIGLTFYRLIKEKLEEFRFPELTRIRKEFEIAKNSLKLKDNCDLSTDKYFENEKLILKITTGSPYELFNIINDIKSEDKRDKWKNIFKIIKN